MVVTWGLGRELDGEGRAESLVVVEVEGDVWGAQSFGGFTPEELWLKGLVQDSHRPPSKTGHPGIHSNGGN